MTSEREPLLGESPNYYFLNSQGNTGIHTQHGDEGETVEDLPAGSTAEEFAPRVLGEKTTKVRRVYAEEKWI